MKDLLVMEESISCLWIFKYLKNSIYSLVKLAFKGGGFSSFKSFVPQLQY